VSSGDLAPTPVERDGPFVLGPSGGPRRRVLKFGGASVGTAAALRLRSVVAERRSSPGVRAAVLALGERLAVPIVAAALRTRGLDSHGVDAASLVRTDEAFAEAGGAPALV
jgi:aspartokinase